jgi:hypothetical protein
MRGARLGEIDSPRYFGEIARMPATSRRSARRHQIVLLRRALSDALKLSDIPGALHKERAVRNLFCRAGRHDFELLKAKRESSATLECMYCGIRRGSTRIRC